MGDFKVGDLVTCPALEEFGHAPERVALVKRGRVWTKSGYIHVDRRGSDWHFRVVEKGKKDGSDRRTGEDNPNPEATGNPKRGAGIMARANTGASGATKGASVVQCPSCNYGQLDPLGRCLFCGTVFQINLSMPPGWRLNTPPSMSKLPEIVATKPQIEEGTQLEPIRAWRGVVLSVANNDVTLHSINYQFGTFTPGEHEATCMAQGTGWVNQTVRYTTLSSGELIMPEPGHEVPDVNCTCGFYAVMDKSQCQGAWIAEVDLYGKVIKHGLGYRAQFQRILSVRFPRPAHCDGFLCDEQAEMLHFPVDRDGSEMTPMGVCQGHAWTMGRCVSMSKLAGRLGVEFRWDDDL